MRRFLSALVAWLLLALAAQAAPRGWENIGPVGGPFDAIAADPADARHVAVFSPEGVFETRDNGSTWRQNPPPCAFVRGAAILGDSFHVNCTSELRRSSDGGATWQVYSAPMAQDTFREFAVHPFAPDTTIGVRGGQRFEVTRDDGATWASYGGYALPTPERVTFDPRAPGRLLALRNSVPQGAFLTALQLVQNDAFGAGEWSTVSNIQLSGGPACYGNDVAVDAGGNIYVVSNCGIWVSRNNGASWDQRIPAGISTALNALTVDAASQRPGRAAVRQSDRIMVTGDGGFNWTTLATGSDLAMAVAADGTVWTAESGRIYRHDANGRAAMPIERRAAVAQYFDVVAEHADVLFASTWMGPMRTTDRGATWSPLAANDPPNEVDGFFPVAGQVSSVYRLSSNVATGSRKAWYSRDSGGTWDEVALAPVPSNYTAYGSFVPVGPQPGIIYGSWSRVSGGFVGQNTVVAAVIRSTDGGRTFTSIDAGLAGDDRDLAVSPVDVSTVYVRTSTGVFRTRDAGATWKQVWSSADRGELWSLSVDQRDPLVAYVVTSNGAVWATENGGDAWRAAPSPTPSTFVYPLLPDPVDARRAFAVSTSGDVFETRDAARTWTQLSTGSPASTVFHSRRVAARGADRWIYGEDANTVLALDLRISHPIALGTDLWFNPAQPGWGVSLAQHDSYQMFAVWFTYDAQGRPTWRFIPGGTWLDATTFTGTLYAASVPPRNFFTTTFTSPAVTAEGSATLHFSDANSAQATFVVGDVTVQQPIVRMQFGPHGKLQLAAASDLWFNPAQSGWGISLHQQYSTMFVTWFLYAEDGSPTWLFMPEASVSNGTTTGDVYRAASRPGTPYQANGVTVSKLGSASFYTQPGNVSATIGGLPWSSPLSRLPF
jgi:photosystem II stability/assembly factor-like uncharacterized protein